MLAGIAIASFFAGNLEDRTRLDLSARLDRLAAAIDAADTVPVDGEPLQDPRFETPFSGYYWQVTDIAAGTTTHSRSLWDVELVPPATDDPGVEQYGVIEGPAGQSLSASARRIEFTDTGKAYLALVAEDRAPLAASVSQFAKDLAIALGVLGLALIAAAWLQVRLGLKPLNAIRAGIEKVRNGGESALKGDFPSEVAPLVVEVNDLLASQAAAIEFARTRAADLAHGLKTPLAVLTSTASQLRDKGDTETAETIDELAADMADRVDYQLRLSRLRVRPRAHLLKASVNDCLGKTVSVLKKTRIGEELDWTIDVPPGLSVDLDPADLVELLGVLLENAAKWARSSVAVWSGCQPAVVVIEVVDDGPGLPETQLAELGVRGHRLDEARSGTGLGLAIAREIVHMNHGKIDFARAGTGGLSVRLQLPAAG